MTRLRLVLPVLLAAASGCNRGGHTGPVERERGLMLLGYTLLEGQTSREDILEQWGVPFSAYEGNRIWTYAFVPERGGIVTMKQPARPFPTPDYETWKSGTYHLILIFEDDLLKDFHLLRIS